jgi:hypothetical protein
MFFNVVIADVYSSVICCFIKSIKKYGHTLSVLVPDSFSSARCSGVRSFRQLAVW